MSEKYRLLAEQIPVLICGDLNSLPDSGSFLYLYSSCFFHSFRCFIFIQNDDKKDLEFRIYI